MNLVVTTDSDDFEATVSATCGACAFFMFIDNQNMKKITVTENPYRHSWSDADIFCAQYIVSQGVEAVISGAFSKNALSVFREARLKVYRCPCIKVEAALKSINDHTLEPLDTVRT